MEQGEDISVSLLNLIRKCIREGDGYVNLDTERINQETTMKRKKPAFIHHHYRFFTQSSEKYEDCRAIISALNDGNSHESVILGMSQLTISKPKGMPGNPPSTATKPRRRRKYRKKRYMENQSKGIPADVRYQVFRDHCDGKMDGICFCCDIPIQFEKWHCGHIKSRATGGSIDPSNLRPVCVTCNLKMSAMHMYEYMLLYDMPGKVRLPLNDPDVKLFKSSVETIRIAFRRLDQLVAKRCLTARQADGYRNKITSKRKSLIERIGVMEEIRKKYISLCNPSSDINLSSRSSNDKLGKSSVEAKKAALQRLNQLVASGHLTVGQSKVYRNMLASKQKSLTEQITVMENIRDIYDMVMPQPKIINPDRIKVNTHVTPVQIKVNNPVNAGVSRIVINDTEKTTIGNNRAKIVINSSKIKK